MSSKDYDGMIQIEGKVKNKQTLISLKTDGSASWDETRMLVLDMIYHLSRFYKDLIERTEQIRH